MQDQPLPNEARLLLDAQIEIREGQTAPVLAQPSTHRMIVLNSTLLNQVEKGQTITMHVPDQESQAIIVESIDRSSLILRYIPA